MRLPHVAGEMLSRTISTVPASHATRVADDRAEVRAGQLSSSGQVDLVVNLGGLQNAARGRQRHTLSDRSRF